MTHPASVAQHDRTGVIIGRFIVGLIAAALGSAAILALYLGATRPGMPVTVPRLLLALPVPAFAVTGWYVALNVWLSPWLQLGAYPQRKRVAIILGVVLALAAVAVYFVIAIRQF